MSYQKRDWEIVDYEEFQLDGTDLTLRGPRPSILRPGAYFSCVGAAQTFGCFCQKPYPQLLSEYLGLPALNLGYAGAGPAFFLGQERVIEYLNASRFVIVQVMSGRSESNRLFESGGLEYLTKRSHGTRIGGDAAYGELLATHPPGFVAEIIAETRANWVDSYLRLLGRIQVPKILFWFSKRAPDYRESYGDIGRLFGEFPQLVNADMIASIRGACDQYVECVTQRGSPQRLVSRFTNRPTAISFGEARPDLDTGRLETHNSYYPSPEMQQDGAKALRKACRRLHRPARGWSLLDRFGWRWRHESS